LSKEVCVNSCSVFFVVKGIELNVDTIDFSQAWDLVSILSNNKEINILHIVDEQGIKCSV